MADKANVTRLSTGETVSVPYVEGETGVYAPPVAIKNINSAAVSGVNFSVVAPNITTTTAVNGRITVTTAGTAVQGTSTTLTNGVFIKALAANTGKVYVGNDGNGDVTSTTGYEMSAGEWVVIQVANLNVLWFDANVNGEGFCWLKG